MNTPRLQRKHAGQHCLSSPTREKARERERESVHGINRALQAENKQVTAGADGPKVEKAMHQHLTTLLLGSGSTLQSRREIKSIRTE